MNGLTKNTIKIPMKCVYVVENQHGHVKIGVSQDVQGRISTLSNQGGFKVNNMYATEHCSNAYQLENRLHKQFKEKKINGEWFSIEFNLAVNAVKTIFDTEGDLKQKKQNCIIPEDIERLFERRD